MLSNRSLTRQSRLKIIDTKRGDAASGVSLCHQNTSASVIAYAHLLHRNQITLQKMGSAYKIQRRKLHFPRRNSENMDLRHVSAQPFLPVK